MKNSQVIAFILLFGFALIIGCVSFFPSENLKQDFNAICVAVVMGIIGIIILACEKRKNGTCFT